MYGFRLLQDVQLNILDAILWYMIGYGTWFSKTTASYSLKKMMNDSENRIKIGLVEPEKTNVKVDIHEECWKSALNFRNTRSPINATLERVYGVTSQWRHYVYIA